MTNLQFEHRFNSGPDVPQKKHLNNIIKTVDVVIDVAAVVFVASAIG